MVHIHIHIKIFYALFLSGSVLRYLQVHFYCRDRVQFLFIEVVSCCIVEGQLYLMVFLHFRF